MIRAWWLANWASDWIGRLAVPFLVASALLVLGLLVMTSGCTSISYTDPDSGATVSYQSLGQKSIKSLRLHTDEDQKRVSVEGYTNEGAELVESAVRGAVQGMQ